MRTITLKTPLSFADALLALKSGEALGMRPGANTDYVIPYRPQWMSGQDFMLVWESSDARSPNSQIRSNQYLESWFLVIADHRHLGGQS